MTTRLERSWVCRQSNGARRWQVTPTVGETDPRARTGALGSRSTDMEPVVVTEPHRDSPHEVCHWPYGKVHLMVIGSEVTLCAEPATGLVPAQPPPAEDVDCELCRLTAST
jgi:hypothetical protein